MSIEELQSKLFDAECEIEKLEKELAKHKKPNCKKLSEIIEKKQKGSTIS